MFDSGAIATPFFCRDSDDEAGSGSEPSTQLESFPYCYQLSASKPIKSITLTLDRLVFITSLELTYSDETIAFSHQFERGRGTSHTQIVPVGRQIIGVYGR